MRRYLVYINREEVAGIYAESYAAAKAQARKLFRVSCDVIG